MDVMKFYKSILLIIILLICSDVLAANTSVVNNSTITPQITPQAPIIASNQTINGTPKSAVIMDGVKNISITAADQQFLFLMNQYWIPDLYDIKGRIDGAAGFGADVPQMLNLSADYARIRLTKNINETNGYNVSPAVQTLKMQYQTGALRSIRVIDGIMALNRSEESFPQTVPMKTAALSLYGSWLEYQVMRCYDLPNSTYPEIASVPADQFMQVMGMITT